MTRLRIDLPALGGGATAFIKGEIEGLLRRLADAYAGADTAPEVVAALRAARVQQRDLSDGAQREAARQEWPGTDLSIDDDAELSLLDAPDGADFGWVQAWVRVDDLPMPVTEERLRWYLESEQVAPDWVDPEHGDTLPNVMRRVHLAFGPDPLVSPSQLRSFLETLREDAA